MSPKETKKAIIINTKQIDIYELLDKELRIILLKEFSELQEHINNKISKTMHEHNEKLNRKYKNIH